MARPLLKLCIMGKTGEGKSATGNTILRRPNYFKTAATTSSETKEVKNGFSPFCQYDLMVVDGPGLQDTDLDKVQDKEQAVNNMNVALLLCHGSIDAFLFVMKFGSKITAEDKDSIETLKKIIGQNFMKHVIVVVTYGDQFENVVEDGECCVSFQDWCKQQTGTFRQLYADCQGRFVLFNNRGKDEVKKQTMIRQVVQLADNLQTRNGSYTCQSFEMAEYTREKMIIEAKAPHLRFEIQKQMSLISAEIEYLSEHPSVEHSRQILQRIDQLDREIDRQDKNFGVLHDFKDILRNMKGHINDRERMSSLNQRLERMRRHVAILQILGNAMSFIGMVLNCVPVPYVSIAASVSEGIGAALKFACRMLQKNVDVRTKYFKG